MSATINSNRETVIAGRATGKTFGITALRLANWMDAMPRSVIRIACYTYEGLKMNVLPGVIQGWEEILKYKEGTTNAKDGGHFWVSKMPPKQFKILKPYRDPKGDIQYQIRWWNGSVLLLSSMDRGINNGGEYDAIAFEEVKLMKRKPVREILLAKRGNHSRFGELSQYGAVLMVTDRPEVHDPGRWVLEEAEKVTPEVNKLILQLCGKIAQLNAEIDQAAREKKMATFQKKSQLMVRYNRYLNELRKNSVNYVEVSTLENIHSLGVKTLVDYYNELDPYEYTISVLTKDPEGVPNSFYPLLDKEIHGYRNINYSYIDSLHISKRSDAKRNVLWDNDTNLDEPLHIGADHNAAINNIVTGQIIGKNAYMLSDLYVESPDYLPALIAKWVEYYAAHRGRVVYYHYNNTSIKDDSQGTPTEADTVIQALRRAGWTVIPQYHGQAPEHGTTLKLWSMSFQDHPDLLGVRFNLQAAGRLVRVMQKTGTRRSGNKTKKDKRSEQFDYRTGKYAVPPPEATHVTEAGDILLLGMQKAHYRNDLSPLISTFGYE